MSSSVVLSLISSYIIGYAISKLSDPMLDAAIEGFQGKSSVEKAYERALKKWKKNNTARGICANSYLSSIALLGQYIEKGAMPNPGLESLCQLFEEELKKDHESFVFLDDLRTKFVHKQMADIFSRLDSLEQPVITGNRVFSDVPNFIPRSCEPLSDDSVVDRFQHPEKYRPVRLLDLVIKAVGAPGADHRFVLYGDAQSGKTTLLRQLGYELSVSGLVTPVMYEVKEYKDLVSALPNLDKQQREYILLVDALDERFRDEDRKTLFRELNGYARRYPDLIIILTCRSNFVEPTALSEFHPLSLLDLSWADARMVLQEIGIGSPVHLLAEIEEKGLYEFARKPAELIAIAEIYLSRKRLPHNVGEIMEHLIRRQLTVEREKSIGEYDTPEETLTELEKVAAALQLMEQNYLTEAELHALLKQSKYYNMVQRSGLLVQARNEPGYGFVHNSFKEYLVVKLLLSLKDSARLRAFCCYDDSTRIKDSWNNVVLMLLSSVPPSDTLGNSIVGWLNDAQNQKLLVHADPSILPESRRAEICIGMLETYKELGLRMEGSWNSSFYAAFMRFGHSVKLIRYIHENLASSKEFTFHTVNLLHCSRFVNWTLLNSSDKSLAGMLREELYSVFARFLNTVEDPYYIFVPFSNPYFYDLHSLGRLKDLLTDVRSPQLIDEFIDIIVESGLTDSFIDFVMKKGYLVRNYRKNGATHILTRIHVYKAFDAVSTDRGVRMAMIGMCNMDPDNEEFESEDFSRVWNKLVEKAEKLSLSDAFLFRRFCQLTAKSRYDERLFKDECTVLADCFRRRGIDGKLFDRTVKAIFRKMESKSHQVFDHLYARAAYLIDEDKAKRFAIEYHSLEGYWLLSYIGFNADEKQRDLIEKVRKEDMKEYYTPPRIPDYQEIDRRNFEEMLDYEAFRKKVLGVIDTVSPMTRKDLRKKMERDLDGVLETGRISRYIISFFGHFADKEGNYDLDAARNAINDRDFYDRFILLYADSKEPMPQILIDTAKKRVLHYIAGGPWPGYPAMKMMMTGRFDIDKKSSMFFLSDSKYVIAYSDGHYHREKTVFDAVSSRDDVSPAEIMDVIGPKLDCEDFYDDNGLLKISLCRFFVKNKLERYLHYCVDWAVDAASANITYHILEQALHSETLQVAFSRPEVIGRFPDDRKSLLLKKLYSAKIIGAKEVKENLEPRLAYMPEESIPDALRLLVSVGSMVALEIVGREEKWRIGIDRLYFKYSCPEALPYLYDLLKYYYPKDIICHESRSSILESIEAIAVSSKAFFQSVSNEFRSIYKQAPDEYKYLLGYIEEWRKTILQNHTRRYTLSDVKRLVLPGNR